MPKNYPQRQRVPYRNRYYDEYNYERRMALQRKAFNSRLKKGSFDFVLFFVILVLLFLGIIMIFSASYYTAMTSRKFNYDMYFFLKKQAMWSVIGLVFMMIAANVPYTLYKKMANFLYGLALLLLAAVLVVGQELNGSKRWLGITDNIGFQPSEFAKVALIIFMAYYISKNRKRLSTLGGFLKGIVIMGVPVALIGASNMSTAIIFIVIGIVMLFVGTQNFVKNALRTLLPIGAVGMILMVKLPQFAYRQGRLNIWKDPFSDPMHDGYQTIQSLYAVASGGLFGLGLGQSRQKTFIPEAHNDIIFAIICEELGLVGAAIIVAVFIVLIWRGIKIALSAVDLFSCLVATGIVTMIGIQVFLNVAVVTNTIPNTGVPLPFISYGGSSLLFTMIAMGILLNISRYSKTE